MVGAPRLPGKNQPSVLPRPATGKVMLVGCPRSKSTSIVEGRRGSQRICRTRIPEIIAAVTKKKRTNARTPEARFLVRTEGFRNKEMKDIQSICAHAFALETAHVNTIRARG